MTNRVYDFTLGAVLGAAQRFEVSGGFVKVLAAPGGQVNVKLDSGEDMALLAGQGIRLPEGKEFRGLTLSNLQAVANAGTLWIGDSTFVDDRVTGVVEVVDGGKARTLLGQAFVGYASLTAAAAQFPCIQLLNPAGTTKRLIVKSINLSGNAAGVWAVAHYDTALTGGPNDTRNKLVAPAAAMTGVVRTQSLAATPGTNLMAFSLAANTLIDRRFEEPLVLAPGRGLVVALEVAASFALVTFDGFEEPNV